MQEQMNALKTALARDELAVGLWCSLASAITTEVTAGAGADWLLVDGEHSPNDLRSILGQLQAAGQYPVEAMVRLPLAETSLVKQFMDIGARSLMVPNVSTAEQARAIVAATQYAPGLRGYSTAHRANRFGRIRDYHATARAQQLLVLQIECETGVANAAGIAGVDGVDAVFVGPGDLSANMGAMGRPGDAPVQKAIGAVLAAARKAGKAAGILAPVEADARRYIEDGFRLVAVGSDLGVLSKGTDALVAAFKGPGG